MQMVSSLVTTNTLATDYLAGKKALSKFFGGHYTDQGRLKALAEKIDRNFDRSRAARLLRAQKTFTGVKQAEERLERFVAEGGFIVATGQQPILFGGPLFVLYKALTLIKIAENAQEILKVPVLPVFWNASEDHDLPEVASIKLPNMQGELETITLASPDKNTGPVCLIELGPETEGLFESLRSILPETEYRAWLLDLLAKGYVQGQNPGHAFSQYLTGLLADFGLFVVDACSPALRRHCRGLFESEIFDAASSIQAVKASSQRLVSEGYELQITPLAMDTHLFMIREGIREKLQLSKTKGAFRLKRSGQEFFSAQITELLDSHPASFSPGVLMRPLVEADFLGTLCYVAGPGEIAYYAQMGGLYRLRNIDMPIIYPRLGGIILERKIARILEKYSLEAEEFKGDVDKLAERMVAGRGPQAQLLEELEKIRSLLKSSFVHLENLITQFDPTLSRSVNKTESSMSGNLDRLASKISAAAKRQNETLVLQLNKAAAQLCPEGIPQERRMASVYYLARYGKDFIKFLLDQFQPELS